MKIEVEGPSDKNCFRVLCHVPNFHGKEMVQAAGPWQANRTQAESDGETLRQALARGGVKEFCLAKSDLFAEARSRGPLRPR